MWQEARPYLLVAILHLDGSEIPLEIPLVMYLAMSTAALRWALSDSASKQAYVASQLADMHVYAAHAAHTG